MFIGFHGISWEFLASCLMILDLGGGACEEATALPGCGELLNVEGLLWYVLHQGSAFCWLSSSSCLGIPIASNSWRVSFFGADTSSFNDLGLPH